MRPSAGVKGPTLGVRMIGSDIGKSPTHTFNISEHLVPKKAPDLNDSAYQFLVLNPHQFRIQGDHS